MNSVSALTALLDEINYVDTQYGGMGTPAQVDRYKTVDIPEDERKAGGPVSREICLWTSLYHKVLRGLPNTTLKNTLYATMGPDLQARPDSMVVAKELLRRMRVTVRSVIDCLRLHGDVAQYGTDDWCKIRMQNMTENDITWCDGQGRQIDGLLIQYEREFYARRKEEAIERPRMRQMLYQDVVQRTATTRGMLVGHYVCRVQGDVLRVVDWAIRDPETYAGRGVPEELGADMLRYLSPRHTPDIRQRSFSSIEFGVGDEHKPIREQQQEVTHGRRFFL